MGLPIIGLGFGKHWKEDFIFELADRSQLLPPGTRGGRVEFIPRPDQVVIIFQEVFKSMQIVAPNVVTNLRMVQGLEARRVWQVTPIIRGISMGAFQGRAVVVQAGDLEQGGAAYLYEIMLPPRPEGAVRIAQTDVTYTVPRAAPERQAVDLVLQFSNDHWPSRCRRKPTDWSSQVKFPAKAR